MNTTKMKITKSNELGPLEYIVTKKGDSVKVAGVGEYLIERLTGNKCSVQVTIENRTQEDSASFEVMLSNDNILFQPTTNVFNIPELYTLGKMAGYNDLVESRLIQITDVSKYIAIDISFLKLSATATLHITVIES